MRLTTCSALLVAAALLAACDEQRVQKLEEGVATELQVRQQFGEPMTVTVEADGTRTMEYPRQPEGNANYVIQIGPDGKMSSLRQLLTPDNFARVQAGQGPLEVRKLLGRPAVMRRFDLKNEDVWEWRFLQGGKEAKVFSVTFDATGKVVGTATADDTRLADPGR
jgi:outer membrane protein assembly factor BamE (lipoprotein component of BamABCDE complex)